ncbi:MAG TPA: hypothetical protein VJ600_07265 [Holophagaceae bacterium]|nr:hypothetical protein [Holophagaceae bacterium]
MVSLTQLWLPILLSAVMVFVASSLIHTVIQWHKSDYHGLSNEDEVRAAIRKGSPAPGMYTLPRCEDMKDMGKPEMQEKFKEGPVAFLVLRANGAPSMGSSLSLWFVYCAIVSVFTAYLTGHAQVDGATFIKIFRFAATAAFMAYAGGALPMGIWWGQPWRAVAKDILDALIYGLITGGTFGWLWPHV